MIELFSVNDDGKLIYYYIKTKLNRAIISSCIIGEILSPPICPSLIPLNYLLYNIIIAA